MVARNGVADATLAPVPGEPGARLRFDAAASWARLAAAVERRYGWRPRLTSAGDAFRPYEVQERIFRQRYTPAGPTSVDRVGKAWDGNGNGVPERWWRLPVWAAAATPGTSNHGWGLACDVTGLGGFNGQRYRELATVAAEHGWDNAEGKAIAEAWHWRYRPENDRHRGAAVARPGATAPNLTAPTPGGALPGALTPEDDDMFDENTHGKDLTETRRMLGVILGHQTPATDGERRYVDRIASVDENRRMLGVLLGYQAPANDIERAALELLRGGGDDDDEDAREARRMLGVLLGWQAPVGPEQEGLDRLRRAAADGDQASADAVAAELGRRLLGVTTTTTTR